MITIRTATQADLSVLLEFEQGIVGFERPFNPTLKPDPISYYDIGELIDAENAEVVVAQDDDLIIASGYAKEVIAAEYISPRKHCFLGFMYVRPEYRGRGINKLVMDNLTTWSRERGLTEMRLQVYSENTGAIRAYEKVGFTGLLLEMRLPLEEEGH